MQRQFPSNGKPTVMAGRGAYPVLPSATAVPAKLEVRRGMPCIPAHAGANGRHVRLKDLHRGGPG